MDVHEPQAPLVLFPLWLCAYVLCTCKVTVSLRGAGERPSKAVTPVQRNRPAGGDDKELSKSI